MTDINTQNAQGSEVAIRHDERKKMIAQGCIHTRKALDGENYDRPDLSQWQHDQSEYFDPTILEIVGEYAVWRDKHGAALSQPPEASEGEAVAVAYASPGQLGSIVDRMDDAGGTYIPLRKQLASKFTMPLYAHPPKPQAAERLAEARREASALREALEQIAENDSDRLHMFTPQAMQHIARAALAEACGK